MSEVVFDDKNKKPGDKDLERVLGRNFRLWNQIDEYVKAKFGDTIADWKYYGKNYGWQIKTLLKKRNLFFRIPYQSYFKIVFVFGDKAVNEIKDSNVSRELITAVTEARKYAEGRGLPIDVTNNKYLGDIKKLIEIKIRS